MPHLEFEARDHRYEIGISAPFAITVDCALNMRRAALDRREGIRHRNIGIIVRVDTDSPVETLSYFRNHLPDPLRQRPAVGIAERQRSGPGRFAASIVRSAKSGFEV